jgi:hypothetical protein
LLGEWQDTSLSGIALGARKGIDEYVDGHDNQPFIREVKAARQCVNAPCRTSGGQRSEGDSGGYYSRPDESMRTTRYR